MKREGFFASLWAELWRRPLARTLLIILALLYLLAAFADFLAPYPEGSEARPFAVQPPNRVHFLKDGRLTQPYIHPLERSLDMTTFEYDWREDTGRTYPLEFFVRRETSRAGRDERYVPFPVNLVPAPLRQRWGITPQASLHLFGVSDAYDRVRLYLWGGDTFGGDVFGNVLFGARISLTLGVLAALLALPVGALLGAVAGFFGGLPDKLIVAVADAVTAIPTLFLVVILSGLFNPLQVSTSATFIFLASALAVAGWGPLARGVRAQALTLREREFVLAAAALGNKRWAVLRRHLLPQILGYIVTYASVLVPSFILLESAVSFFGLGVQPPSRSWGLLMAELMGVSEAEALDRGGSITGLVALGRWWLWLPGAALFLATLVWVLLGEEVREVLDPRAQRPMRARRRVPARFISPRKPEKPPRKKAMPVFDIGAASGALFRQFRTRRLESVLIVVAVALGVAVVTAVAAFLDIGRQAEDNFIANLNVRELGLRARSEDTSTFYAPGEAPAAVREVGTADDAPVALTPADLEAAKRAAPAARHAYLRGVTAFGNAALGEDFLPASAVTAEYQAAAGLTVSSGSLLSESDFSENRRVMLITPRMARRLQLAGDPVGQRVAFTGEAPYTIVGLLPDTGEASNVREVVVPWTPAAIYELYFAVSTPDALPQARAELAAFAQARWDGRVVVSSRGASVRAFNERQRARGLVIALFASTGLAVAALNIMTLMLARVLKRRRAIGVQRSLGATRGAILRQFLGDALVLAGLGGLLGAPAGYGLLAVYNRYLSAATPAGAFSVGFSPVAALTGLALALCVGVIFGLYPALLASRVRVVDALKEV